MAARLEPLLDDFARGRCDAGALERALEQTLSEGDADIGSITTLVMEQYQRRRLPTVVYLRLRERLERAQQATAGEHTRFATPAEGDHPRFGPPGGPAADEGDGTRIGQSIVAAPPPADIAVHPSAPASAGSVPSARFSRPASDRGPPGSGPSGEPPPPRNPEQVAIGDVLKGRFVLVNKLGEGGMGIVYKARDTRREAARDSNPYVAVKVLNPQYARHSEFFVALQRECRRVQDLASDNIVRVYDFDTDDSRPLPLHFMTMEYLDGQSLDRYIKNQVPAGGLDYATARPIIAALASGLAYAHRRGLVHSDFKPGNVFITRRNEVKILDFGIARIADREQAARDGYDAGVLRARTPSYASLEMFQDQEPDPRDDIYGLACVAYELLAGQHPFNRKSAVYAKDHALRPARIGKLGRRQWQGLEHGLKLLRTERTPGAERFLAELDGQRKRRLPVLVGSAAAGLLLYLGAEEVVRDYLLQERIQELRRDLDSADPQVVAKAAERLAGEDKARRDQLVDDADVQAALTRYFIRQSQARVDEAAGRYDFPGAQALLDQAMELYKDYRLFQEREELIERRNSLLSELNQTFTTHLNQGRLADVQAVLARVRQIDPQHPLLQDPRLASAYAQAVETRLERDDLEAARRLLAEAAGVAGGDQLLASLHERLQVRGEQRRREDEQRRREAQIAALARSLEDAAPDSLDDFR
ncbi:MAG: serine/threonine protein kinase, partial [Pseudomonadota bacterium]|nr:serine/threonine protein kinase [Pseudomonadota bacterium]